jgi:dTDP-4-dehydrorhamnose reductase
MDIISMDKKWLSCNRPEIWGGLECTINRVNDVYRDQLKVTGHYLRPDDLEAFASLGISKIRYPVLWEKHQPDPKGHIDWSWASSQLETIRSFNIDPIIGLLHHGSGPVTTSLLDPSFPEKVSAYAKEVANRFPWVKYYTPINEPLTTARFSGLYGFWYPHKKDELSFAKMLLNQVKAIILCMQEIHKINPDAKLVQTEDLSKTHSTPHLAYQANFENERRWLTYDLLCGKFNKHHFFYDYFLSLGIPEAELAFFCKQNFHPDIIGFNYYVTSERYLDEKIENYPTCNHGGNGKHKYADIEAVRSIQLSGLENLLREAWERFKFPLAVTECHINCTREEQLRWFKEAWETCCNLNENGVSIKAITAWALLGACDWNSLLTCSNKYYESGVFDVRRRKKRRPTALVKMIRSLATTGDFNHPLLQESGWWKKQSPGAIQKYKSLQVSPLLITGKNGTLGQVLMKICEGRSIPYIALSRAELDIADEDQIQKAINTYKPWGIVNAAGYVKVDDAEIERNKCYEANSTGPQLLARISGEKGIRFVTFSSGLVFNGDKETPYGEFDSINPLNIYGKSKAKGEEYTLQENKSSLVIRTSAFFGPWDKYNFAYHILNALKSGHIISAAHDIIVSPTYIPDLANATLDLLIDEATGIWHLCNEGSLSWADFAKEIAVRGGHNIKLEQKSWVEMDWQARRPLYSAMQSERGIQLPELDNALGRFFEEQIF